MLNIILNMLLNIIIVIVFVLVGMWVGKWVNIMVFGLFYCVGFDFVLGKMGMEIRMFVKLFLF